MRVVYKLVLNHSSLFQCIFRFFLWTFGVFHLTWLLPGCVEPYEIETRDFDQALVVDARFTDEQKAHYVKLSYTRPMDEFERAPVTGAEVWIESSDGGKIAFTEIQDGLYLTDSTVAGVAGQSYQLKFKTSDGKQYQSRAEYLQYSPPIDSIYTTYAESISSSNDAAIGGIQFFLDTHDDQGNAKYFRYEWEETYEVHTAFPSTHEYLWEEDSAVAREEPISVCYASGGSSAIILGSTVNLSESKLVGQELRFISPATDQLKYAYSILARQYAISFTAYSFYREVVANNDQGGSLFGKQLGAVVGNITAVDGTDEVILGFYEVSGVSEKRIFVRYEDLDPRFSWPQDKYPCSGDQVVSISDTDSLTHYTRGKGYGVISANYCDTTGITPCPFIFKADLAPLYCIDCTFRGLAEKPDFWIF